MKPQSTPRRAGLILPLLMLALVSACAKPTVQGVQTYPRAADLQAVTQPEPLPSSSTADDPQAAERDNVAVEAWGKGLHDAGVRICNWAKERGLALTFQCQRNPQ